MATKPNKFQDPRQFLTSMNEEHFHKNLRSAIDYYGEDYMDKLLKVTGGRILHDYVAPRFTLPRKYRRWGSMTIKIHKLPTGMLILVLIGMTACASIIPQNFYEKKTTKVNVKNEPTYSMSGTILSREPVKNIIELDIKF